MHAWHFIFWISVAVVGWTYVGYFITLLILSAFMKRPVQKAEQTPPVTLVITAWNEERRIERKICNSLEIDYPRGQLHIIVVSDGSTDGTDDIVRSFADHGVKLLRVPKRTGKHFGQRQGIEAAESDIIVLSDATTFLEPLAVRKIVENFADPTVGVVSGEDRVEIEDSGEISGEGAYVRYEMKLREYEARVGGLIGASGCFFAIRKELAMKTWVDDMSSDFFMPIVAQLNGMRTVNEPEAVGVYRVVPDPSKEYMRKVRTVLHGLEVLFHFKSVMNPFKHGFFAFQIISHKLMRWLAPITLLAAFITSTNLVDGHPFYKFVFIVQVAFYGLALLGRLVPRLQNNALFRIPFFFVMVNVSIIEAWWQYIRGEKQVIWEATKR